MLSTLSEEDIGRLILRAKTFSDTNAHNAVVQILLPLLDLSELEQEQECTIRVQLSNAYYALTLFKIALDHTNHWLLLVNEIYEPRSFDHAIVFEVQSRVHMQLQDYSECESVATTAVNILNDLDLKSTPLYGRLHMTLGDICRERGQHSQALKLYSEARTMSLIAGDGAGLINKTAVCYAAQNQWNEAVAALKEAVGLYSNTLGTEHHVYGTAQHNLAFALMQLGEYSEAIPRFEEALTIFKQIYGANHKRTLKIVNELTNAMRLAAYCINCNKVLTKQFKCSRCKQVKYCGKECQIAHWPQHKTNCVKPQKQKK